MNLDQAINESPDKTAYTSRGRVVQLDRMEIFRVGKKHPDDIRFAPFIQDNSDDWIPFRNFHVEWIAVFAGMPIVPEADFKKLWKERFDEKEKGRNKCQ